MRDSYGKAQEIWHKLGDYWDIVDNRKIIDYIWQSLLEKIEGLSEYEKQVSNINLDLMPIRLNYRWVEYVYQFIEGEHCLVPVNIPYSDAVILEIPLVQDGINEVDEIILSEAYNIENNRIILAGEPPLHRYWAPDTYIENYLIEKYFNNGYFDFDLSGFDILQRKHILRMAHYVLKTGPNEANIESLANALLGVPFMPYSGTVSYGDGQFHCHYRYNATLFNGTPSQIYIPNLSDQYSITHTLTKACARYEGNYYRLNDNKIKELPEGEYYDIEITHEAIYKGIDNVNETKEAILGLDPITGFVPMFQPLHRVVRAYGWLDYGDINQYHPSYNKNINIVSFIDSSTIEINDASSLQIGQGINIIEKRKNEHEIYGIVEYGQAREITVEDKGHSFRVGDIVYVFDGEGNNYITSIKRGQYRRGNYQIFVEGIGTLDIDTAGLFVWEEIKYIRTITNISGDNISIDLPITYDNESVVSFEISESDYMHIEYTVNSIIDIEIDGTIYENSGVVIYGDKPQFNTRGTFALISSEGHPDIIRRVYLDGSLTDIYIINDPYPAEYITGNMSAYFIAMLPEHNAIRLDWLEDVFDIQTSTEPPTPAPTTTVVPTTTTAPTTTVAPTTTTAPTTTVAPTTTAAPTTTIAPTTTAAPTTTVVPTTTAAPTTSVVPTTTAAPTTSVVPTTTIAPTTTAVPTTTDLEPTTTPLAECPTPLEPPNYGDPDAGEETNPYQIETVNNLQWLSLNDAYWDKHFIQTADIDASDIRLCHDEEGWRPIGNWTTEFSGKYDGNEKKISNLYFRSETYDDPVGTFGWCDGGEIIDLTLEYIYIESNAPNWVAGLVGYSSGNTVIRGIKVTGEIHATATGINGARYVAGILGDGASVVDCVNEADIYAVGKNIGGVAGDSSGPEIINCKNYGDIICDCDDGTADNPTMTHEVGGICGYARSNAAIINCENHGNIVVKSNGIYHIGGIAGEQRSGESENCHNYGNINITLLRKGTSDIIWCATIGGIAGYRLECDETINMVNHAPITFDFQNTDGSTQITMEDIGGVYGNLSMTRSSVFEGLVNKGNITIGDYTADTVVMDSFGGAIGMILASGDHQPFIRKSYSTGEIDNGIRWVGGFIGRTSISSPLALEIHDCYSRTDVKAPSAEDVGGFIGRIHGTSNSNTIKDCYSAGIVEGDTNVGGFIGELLSTVTLEKNYWDIEYSEQINSKGENPGEVEGRTTDEMTYPYDTSENTTFVDWDFLEVWADDTVGDVNNGYPYLIPAPE